MPTSMMAEIEAMGHELGAHTLTHRPVANLSDAALAFEIEGSKHWMEDVLGHEVRSFCYPRGRHSVRAVEAVRRAGFSVGRTTLAGHTRPVLNALRMPVTLQLYDHSVWSLLRHAGRYGDIVGALNITRAAGRSYLDDLERYGRDVGSPHGVLHLWGHSWEIEQLGLWDMLADALDILSSFRGSAVCNGALARPYEELRVYDGESW